MRYFNTIVITVLIAIFLSIAPADAQNKFKNEDTAKNRQDNVLDTGHRERATDITVEKDESGATVIRSRPAPKDETDWYDKTDMKLGVDLEKQVD